MPIKIDKKTGRITLKTRRTMYVLEMKYGKYPVHLYYGKLSPKADAEYKCPLYSFAPYYEEYGWEYFPDVVMSEYPFFGSGDFRASAMKLRHLGNGNDTTLFTFRSARKFRGRKALPGLPFAEADRHTETLELTLNDDVTGCLLKLYYTVFKDCDVISRYFILENKGDCAVRLEKTMMLALDIPKGDYDLLTFTGGHCCERSLQRTPVMRGNQSIFSRRGASSHHFNPFMMIADRKATEERGNAYGFNLVYSGSFLNEIETDQTGTTRVLTGLGSECFNWLLEPGESFTSPEAVMSFSSDGIGQVSRNMHRFVRNHILPPEPFENRPVVLNSWEAFYFNIDAKLMTEFAAEAAKCGMDTVVMDDGWFGKRVNDHAGLGDWYENPDRFPEGLKKFAEEVKAQGVKFGIWIEPEMVNPDSDLFRAHPEWCIRAPGRELMVSRSQLVLDMANGEVVEYLKRSFKKVFDGVPIDYFKWDMNRHMCEVGSPALPPERQGEVAYRYMLGVYELFRWFNEQYPNAMIENCSGGGGRYDLGMMKYSSQIWTSDNTGPVRRTYIQHGSSFGYPAAVMSCHVSNHHDACEDPRMREFLFRVALNGPLGYEFNIFKVSDDAKEAFKKQVAEFRRCEKLIMTGDLYRLLDPNKCGKYCYYFASENSKEILLTFAQNFDDPRRTVHKLKISKALQNAVYTDLLSGKEYSGEELRRGIEIESSEQGNYAMTLHLVRK